MGWQSTLWARVGPRPQYCATCGEALPNAQPFVFGVGGMDATVKGADNFPSAFGLDGPTRQIDICCYCLWAATALAA
jgi:hypothetical protein